MEAEIEEIEEIFKKYGKVSEQMERRLNFLIFIRNKNKEKTKDLYFDEGYGIGGTIRIDVEICSLCDTKGSVASITMGPASEDCNVKICKKCINDHFDRNT